MRNGLCLKRRLDEEVVIQVGDTEIVVLPVRIVNGEVRLKFYAPEHVVIHRREVVEKIQRERGAA